MSDEPAIKVDGLWEGYQVKSQRGWRRGEIRWALEDINFEVAPGEILGVIGGNGSGKSTLLLCVAGVLKATRGKVTTRGRVASLVELQAGFNRELTGKENALTAGVLGGMSRKEVRARYPEILAFAGLSEETMNSPLRTYSQGMRLRVGFSVTVHSDPSVLLVDEVLAVGDEGFQQKCLKKVSDMRLAGCGVLLVSHDLDLIVKECDRVAVLVDGKMEHLGTPAESVALYRELTGGNPDDQLFGGRAYSGKGLRRAQRRGV
jgi:ABC-type polysaccharide/polyol phosphate transport system ATPase subunit